MMCHNSKYKNFYPVQRNVVLRKGTTLPEATIMFQQKKEMFKTSQLPGYFQNTEMWELISHQAVDTQGSLAPLVGVWHSMFIIWLFYAGLHLPTLLKYQVPVSWSVSKCCFVYQRLNVRQYLVNDDKMPHSDH